MKEPLKNGTPVIGCILERKGYVFLADAGGEILDTLDPLIRDIIMNPRYCYGV